jgi:hypothetical protein
VVIASYSHCTSCSCSSVCALGLYMWANVGSRIPRNQFICNFQLNWYFHLHCILKLQICHILSVKNCKEIANIFVTVNNILEEERRFVKLHKLRSISKDILRITPATYSLKRIFSHNWKWPLHTYPHIPVFSESLSALSRTGLGNLFYARGFSDISKPPQGGYSSQKISVRSKF